MELLGILAFTGGWVVLGVLANRFGHDSRPSITDPAAGPLTNHTGGRPLAPLKSFRPRARLVKLAERTPPLAHWQMTALAKSPVLDARIASKLSL